MKPSAISKASAFGDAASAFDLEPESLKKRCQRDSQAICQFIRQRNVGITSSGFNQNELACGYLSQFGKRGPIHAPSLASELNTQAKDCQNRLLENFHKSNLSAVDLWQGLMPSSRR